MTSNKRKLKLLLAFNRIRLKNMPILMKLSLIMVVVFLLMAILSYVTFTIFLNDKKSSTLTVIKQSNLQTLEKVDDYIKDIENITKLPLTIKDKDLSYLTEMDEFNASGNESFALQKMNLQMFNDLFSYKDQIHSVFVYNLHGVGDYKIKGGLYKNFNPINEQWFKDSISNAGKPLIISSFKLPFISDNASKSDYVFSIARGISNLKSNKIVGIMTVNTSVDFLSNICKHMVITPNQRIIIEDNIGNVIYDTKEENVSQKLDDSIRNINWDSQKPNNLNVNGQNLLASTEYSTVTGWRIINLVPTNELYKDINKLKNLTVAITIIIILITTLLMFLISNQIASPIKKLVTLLNVIEKGDFNVKIKLSRKDEIGNLAKSFNSMTRKVKNLIDEVYLDKIKQTELELHMLQNQINPHFLYNTLESISMMATINDDEKTSEMASALGTILRYGIDQKNVHVFVKEEINNLENYIMLQKCRFQNMYNITTRVDEAILDNKIIKLILQPVVENAIYHGMQNTRSGGKIDVLGYEKNSILVFEVIDNGAGMEAEKLLSLNEYINELNDSFKSIGLRNVNKRIKLNYGNNYGIKIFSTLGLGTRVEIKLPI
ncbi:MAG: histidine kinase [Clostridiaceae bacterium]|nr:histidine kinase [Clostridiaceae bacterium]